MPRFIYMVIIFMTISGLINAQCCGQMQHEEDHTGTNISREAKDQTTITTPAVELNVKGACGMCGFRIERTAKNLDGVQDAEWDEETQVLTLHFDEAIIDLDTIAKAIAEAGHDNELHRAPDEAYEELHYCCKYERD